ncbi:MAG: DUF6655 family protein [Phycisphaeraceae bacterium]
MLRFAALILLLLSPLLGGCATIRVTDPGRTATEQFLISQAGARAVEQLSASALHDRAVFIEASYFDRVDEPYLLGELRSHLLQEGVRLVDAPAEAEVVLEVRSRGVGIDRYDYLVGIPPVLIPAGDVGVIDDDGSGTLITPELAFFKSIHQQGYASVAFVAYWRDTGEWLSSSGPAMGTALREDWWFFGLGPYTTGSVVTIPEQDPE